MNNQIHYYQHKLSYEIDAWDLKVLLEMAPADVQSVVVIDARSAEAFATAHIPGAINIPHKHISPITTAHINTASLVVVYCDGIGCNASTKGAMAMCTLGFKVKELIGGLEWWQRDGYATMAVLGSESAGNCGCD